MNGIQFKHRYFVWLVVAMAFISSGPTLAIEYGEQLSTIELSARAHHLYAIIRCPTCNGQSLESSESETAFDLRQVIRGQLEQGHSDAEITDYLKQCYGQSISFDPGISKQTIILWGLPLLLLLLGIVMLGYRLIKNGLQKNI